MSDCGCCDPTAPVSPRTIYNRPALSALKYRIGTFSSFRRAMINAAAAEPALRAWTSRDTDDYGIAAIELWAYLADILTFYQERIINEAFLRTVVQRESLMHLAGLIDYKLAPGVAATAYLAFLVDKTNPVIPAGLRVQSKPAPGQPPATFETGAALSSSINANQFRVWPVPTPDLENYGQGNDRATLFSGGDDLKQGQLLVFFAGTHVEEKKISSIDAAQRGRQVTWSPPIATAFPHGAEVYRLGRKFTLFGHNAPDSYLAAHLDSKGNVDYVYPVSTDFGLKDGTDLYLDGIINDLPVNTQVLVLNRGSFTGLFTIMAIRQTNSSVGPLSGTATRITLQSESYPSEVPIGTNIREIEVLELTSGEISFSRRNFGDPALIPAGAFQVYSDQIQPTDLAVGGLLLISDDSGAAEQVTLTNILAFSQDLVETGTLLEFSPPLTNAYSGETAVMHGNVVAATHGETIKDEVLGSSDGAQASQVFVLKKSPVTFTPDKIAEHGALNSLQIMVSGIRWKEAPNFYGRGPDERIYVTSIDENNGMHVEFGDGVRGARLPSGANNIHSKYRKGWGKEGDVAAGKLTTLLDARPGLKSVSNPAPSFGWDEPETQSEARQNAPTAVLTFDRAVSLRDFENLARTFPGVGKARADWFWNDEQQVVRLTCAASDGKSIVPIRDNLSGYLNQRRDPNRQLEIVDFTPVSIHLHAMIVPDPDYDPAVVLANAQAAVGTDQLPDQTYGFFAFERQNLGADVHLSEVYEVLQNVPGVVAVHIDELYRTSNFPFFILLLQNIVPIGPSELAVLADPSDSVIELRSEL